MYAKKEIGKHGCQSKQGKETHVTYDNPDKLKPVFFQLTFLNEVTYLLF